MRTLGCRPLAVEVLRHLKNVVCSASYRRAIFKLAFLQAPESVRNEQGLYVVLDMYSRVYWDNPNEVPLERNRRRDKNYYLSCLGRRHGCCGDFIFIDL